MKNSHSSSGLLALNTRLFALGMAVFVLFAGVSLLFVHHYFLEQTQQRHFAKQTLLLDERIDKKVKILHAVGVMLANNSTIQQALTYEDRELIMAEMADLDQQFAYWTGFLNYSFHIATFDARSFYRSYAPDSHGQNLTDHPLIRKAINNPRKAHEGIEPGGFNLTQRMLNIQPVYARENPEELVGFAAVSQGLRTVVHEFAQEELEYYIFELDAQDPTQQRFVVDSAPYFANRLMSDWVFRQSHLDHNKLQLRNNWYYQTHPIYDEQQQLKAFHLVLTPKQQIHDQAWLQTQQVLWIWLFVFVALFFGGLTQLGLLKRNVIKPMQAVSQTLNNIIRTERYDQPLVIHTQDEIGQVSELFNQMLNKTDKLIFDLNYQKMAIDKTLILSKANPRGTIVEVNDNFCTISGYSREELIGQPHNIVRHPDMDSAVFKQLWQTIQAKQIWQGEVQNRRKDGTSYYVMSYIIPILNRKGDIQEYLSIREDITLIVELREGLQQALAGAQQDKLKAERANQAKSDFLSSMSHELRTPLNAIIGYAQLLEIAQLEPKHLKQVNTILSSSKHLLALINDILDFAKLESGKIQFDLKPYVVADLVNEALTLIKPMAQQQGIQLKVEPLATNLFIQVDRLRIKQVMVNILSNAIKYNKAAGSVCVGCQQISKHKIDYWMLTISDSGVGIAEKDLEKLFEPFNRLGHEGSTIQGTGIGLSITKDLVEQMHGWLEVDSVEGEGTSVHLFFPIVKSLENPQPDLDLATKVQVQGDDAGVKTEIPAQKPAQNTTSEFKLLYIGSDLASLQALSRIVSAQPQLMFKVAPNPQNALAQLNELTPDLVLIDSALAEQIDLSAYASRQLDSNNIASLESIINTHLDQHRLIGINS
ncbi:ATP-binding protein [Thiomicrospira microaerophila]|uniref:ATP-binding protein n=1 Tax=Thiomicrospira microaerophila TaxID=406020 RepID=UPI00069741FC|nr:ATP-binding protein [Thiomicrospira microaerophila]